MDLSKLSSNPSTKQAQADLTSFYRTRKNPVGYYNEAVEKLGVPDARAAVARDRKAITDTQNLVDAVDPSVTGRTSGSLVTEAQRQGLVTREKTPLLESLGKLQTGFADSRANLADLMSQANLQSQFGIQADQNVLAALTQRLDQARYDEEQRRVEAEQAKQNAWATALQESLASMRERLTGQLDSLDQSRGRINAAQWSALSNPLRVNTAYYDNLQNVGNYNPQRTFNPMAGRTFNPQRSGGVQRGAGNINNLVTRNLRVSSAPSRGRVRVTGSPTRRNLAVTAARNRSNLRVR